MNRIRSRTLKTNPILNINGKQYAPKYEEIKNISLEIDSDMKNTGIIVIPDNAVSENMKAINIENMRKGNMLNSIILTAGFIILIYGGYFLISYFSSKRILKEK